MDLFALERQIRAKERELAQEVRAGEVDPSSPFAALRCERLYRTVTALRKRRTELLDSARKGEAHVVPTSGTNLHNLHGVSFEHESTSSRMERLKTASQKTHPNVSSNGMSNSKENRYLAEPKKARAQADKFDENRHPNLQSSPHTRSWQDHENYVDRFLDEEYQHHGGSWANPKAGPLPAYRMHPRAEQWLQPTQEDPQIVDAGEWEWHGRTLRVMKNVVYSDSEILERLLAKARALELKLAELEAEKSARQTSPVEATWSDETKETVARGEEIGEERARVREAAREQLRKRAALLREEYQHNSAILVQSTFRGFLGRRKMREAREKYAKAIREAGATSIQCQFRSFMARRQVRIRKAELERDLQHASAVVIQSTYRGALARRRFREAKAPSEREEAAACLIQAWWRGCCGRQEVLTRRQRYIQELEEVAAVMVQTAWRGHKARREKDRLLAARRHEQELAAAIMFQSAWRGYQARKKVDKLRREIEDTDFEIKSKEYTENVKKAFYVKGFLNVEQRAAVCIQCYARGFLERKRLALRKSKLAQRAKEDAEIDRMIEEERARRELNEDLEETIEVPKIVYEDTLDLPIQWSDGFKDMTKVHIVVREKRSPYQLRIEAEEGTTHTKFYRMIDTSVLEQLLLPVFSDANSNHVFFQNNGNRRAGSIESDAQPMIDWVLYGEPPRRKHLIAWILNRMWIDQPIPNGALELCLGSFSNADHLNKTMTPAIPPSSPFHSRQRQQHSNSQAQDNVSRQTSKPIRQAFKVKYRKDVSE